MLSLTAFGQFTFTTNNGTLTVTRYTGAGGDVVIPGTTNGYTVTAIGIGAFENNSAIRNLTIPDSIVIINTVAFRSCTGLTNVNFGTGLTTLGGGAFEDCVDLASVVVPSSVTNLGAGVFNSAGLTTVSLPNGINTLPNYTFQDCVSLTNLSIPNSVTNIASFACQGCLKLNVVTVGSGVNSLADDSFSLCTSLKNIIFLGNAPAVGKNAFGGDNNPVPTAYYLPGTIGWSNTLDVLPAVLWNPQAQTSDSSFGFLNHQFGFNITGTANIPIVVQASSDFGTSSWVTVQNCTLTNGLVYFSDPQSANYPDRFYRISFP